MPNVFWFLFFLKEEKVTNDSFFVAEYHGFSPNVDSCIIHKQILHCKSSDKSYCKDGYITCSTGIDYLITVLANQISLLFYSRKNRTPLKHEFMFQPHFYITTLLVLFTIFF
eukprot:TRINITY_DN32958_c3_g1_i1.p1 TRINITY_DN32958_c3_g1~~TRINITY_DN32958_c3_g1_i1.p1  ORF type:complete len:112 (+),score=8.44 TRINITY_DN32958_c3_g1_i1:682-1017(+)